METARCPIEVTLALISGKWKILIIRELLGGEKRFGLLQKALEPISAKILTQHLREMENDSLVERKVYPELPPRVDYALTGQGYSLLPIMTAMRKWGLVQEHKYNTKCSFCQQCERNEEDDKYFEVLNIDKAENK